MARALDQSQSSARARQLGPDRVALDIAQHRQQVLVLLDREGLEPALPDVAAAVVVLVVTAHVGVLQPVHPAAEIAVAVRPHRQVEVVGHEAVGQDGHGDLDAGVPDGLEERLVVPVLHEDLAAGVAAVEDVVAHPADRGSGRSWHGRYHSREGRECQ